MDADFPISNSDCRGFQTDSVERDSGFDWYTSPEKSLISSRTLPCLKRLFYVKLSLTCEVHEDTLEFAPMATTTVVEIPAEGVVPALQFVIEGPSLKKSPVVCGVTAEGETMPVMATAELPGECGVSLSGLSPVVHG